MKTSEPDKTAAGGKRTVLLVDDHPIVLEGLTRRINSESDFLVCGEAQTPAQALLAIQELQPDVVVVDLALKEGHGLELIKDIRSHQYRMPILVFTMIADATYAVRSLRAGAQGYVSKHEPPELLVDSLRAVLRGQSAVSTEISKQFLESSLRPEAGAAAPQDCLGDRELEVFELLGHGIGTREIAARLSRSVKTIETYRARIKRKLNITDSNSLVREAVRWVESCHRSI